MKVSQNANVAEVQVQVGARPEDVIQCLRVTLQLTEDALGLGLHHASSDQVRLALAPCPAERLDVAQQAKSAAIEAPQIDGCPRADRVSGGASGEGRSSAAGQFKSRPG